MMSKLLLLKTTVNESKMVIPSLSNVETMSLVPSQGELQTFQGVKVLQHLSGLNPAQGTDSQWGPSKTQDNLLRGTKT